MAHSICGSAGQSRGFSNVKHDECRLHADDVSSLNIVMWRTSHILMERDPWFGPDHRLSIVIGYWYNGLSNYIPTCDQVLQPSAFVVFKPCLKVGRVSKLLRLGGQPLSPMQRIQI